MTPHPSGQVRVIGGGPIGLLLTALLQSMDGPPVRLYDRRGGYTRTRMVSLAPYLVADSIESYGTDSQLRQFWTAMARIYLAAAAG